MNLKEHFLVQFWRQLFNWIVSELYKLKNLQQNVNYSAMHS